MDDDKRIDDNSILGNGEPTSGTSSTDSGANTSNEINSEYTAGEETINEYNERTGENMGERTTETYANNTLPAGCNVFYGNYIDNYNGTTRNRYYLDSYGQLILSQKSTNVNRPTGIQCLTEMPMSHNMDMGIIAGSACAAIAIYIAVKFVVGRLIK